MIALTIFWGGSFYRYAKRRTRTKFGKLLRSTDLEHSSFRPLQHYGYQYIHKWLMALLDMYSSALQIPCRLIKYLSLDGMVLLKPTVTISIENHANWMSGHQRRFKNLVLPSIHVTHSCFTVYFKIKWCSNHVTIIHTFRRWWIKYSYRRVFVVDSCHLNGTVVFTVSECVGFNIPLNTL